MSGNFFCFFFRFSFFPQSRIIKVCSVWPLVLLFIAIWWCERCSRHRKWAGRKCTRQRRPSLNVFRHNSTPSDPPTSYLAFLNQRIILPLSYLFLFLSFLLFSFLFFFLFSDFFSDLRLATRARRKEIRHSENLPFHTYKRNKK